MQRMTHSGPSHQKVLKMPTQFVDMGLRGPLWELKVFPQEPTIRVTWEDFFIGGGDPGLLLQQRSPLKLPWLFVVTSKRKPCESQNDFAQEHNIIM